MRARPCLDGSLARAIPPQSSRLRDVERAGREIAPTGAVSLQAAPQDTLTGLGFQPLVERHHSGGLSCRLRNCPYRDCVRDNQEVVCTLHRGITQGMLSVLDPGARLAGFTPRDPYTAGCKIEIDGLPAVADAAAPT